MERARRPSLSASLSLYYIPIFLIIERQFGHYTHVAVGSLPPLTPWRQLFPLTVGVKGVFVAREEGTQPSDLVLSGEIRGRPSPDARVRIKTRK